MFEEVDPVLVFDPPEFFKYNPALRFVFLEMQ
jgi:hypothetical protein